MKITIKYKNAIKTFENTQTIVIGNSPNSDFVVSDFEQDEIIKLVYTQQYNNYIMINVNKSEQLICNNKFFSKILVMPNFNVFNTRSKTSIDFSIKIPVPTIQKSTREEIVEKKVSLSDLSNVTDSDIEEYRISIIKDIGTKITQYKNNINSLTMATMIANASMFLLSIASAFGVTNFLLGFKIDTTSSVLNLTTNFGFLACISIIIFAISMILKQGIYSFLEETSQNKYATASIQRFMIGLSLVFLFIIYIINLYYFKAMPNFAIASFFISLLFVGTLAISAIGSGYFKFQINDNIKSLTNCEFREDFEAVMKKYRLFIAKSVNALSPNKINMVKNNLLNSQMRMIVEFFIGLLTAPFLAYGVSNTLASCFPEAANWQRISGLRFSPIFLPLATFLIIFAFFTFVRAFTIGKQIKASEIIKFDGYHDYNHHGVTILGLDSMRSLEKERKVVFFIACFIIAIEFTMNVSYFITEMGADMQGLFLSVVTALVPTALLIAETHMLSSTMHKINNYNDLLATLD